jgi:hypothetical protein
VGPRAYSAAAIASIRRAYRKSERDPLIGNLSEDEFAKPRKRLVVLVEEESKQGGRLRLSVSGPGVRIQMSGVAGRSWRKKFVPTQITATWSSFWPVEGSRRSTSSSATRKHTPSPNRTMANRSPRLVGKDHTKGISPVRSRLSQVTWPRKGTSLDSPLERADANIWSLTGKTETALARYRRFDSSSLQRGVFCETLGPCFTHVLRGLRSAVRCS